MKLAIESFYENNEGENEEDEDLNQSSDLSKEDLSDPIPTIKTNNPPSQPQQRQSTRNTASNKIFTLNSMSNDNNEEEGQAFYAGGSDQSGQQILGPPRQTHESIIKNLFSKAKEYE